MECGEGVLPFLLGNLNVCSKLERRHGGLAGVAAIQFGQSLVVLALIHEQVNEARVCFGIIGPEFEILTVGIDSLGFLLHFQTFREAAERVIDGTLWIQLDAIMDALDEVNRPFRKKGAVSQTVRSW